MFYKTLSILLIPVLLFSTTSFSVDKHICMDSVYSISIFDKADDCNMQMDHCDKLTLNNCILSDENSCKDENHFVAGSKVNLGKPIRLNLNQTNCISFINFSKFYFFTSNLNRPNPNKNYSPLRITKNINILNQVFKI